MVEIKTESEHPPFHASMGFYILIFLLFILALVWMCCHYGCPMCSNQKKVKDEQNLIEFGQFVGNMQPLAAGYHAHPEYAKRGAELSNQNQNNNGIGEGEAAGANVNNENQLEGFPDLRTVPENEHLWSIYKGKGDEKEHAAEKEEEQSDSLDSGLYGGAQSPGGHEENVLKDNGDEEFDKRFPMKVSRGLSVLSLDYEAEKSTDRGGARLESEDLYTSEPSQPGRNNDNDDDGTPRPRSEEEDPESPVRAFARLSRARSLSESSTFREYEEPEPIRKLSNPESRSPRRRPGSPGRPVSPRRRPSSPRLPKRSIVQRSLLAGDPNAPQGQTPGVIAGKDTKRFPRRRVMSKKRQPHFAVSVTKTVVRERSQPDLKLHGEKIVEITLNKENSDSAV